jgi:dipeptidyl aminopeptidase/acylaminoacyl peptidase
MGIMKDFDIRIRNGGDDAIAAACELAGIAKERRGYEDTKNATGDITDIVTVLRGVGFAAVSPSAGDSASMLHYCVTHAADEIEHLRAERQWIPVTERLPDVDATVLVAIETPSGRHVSFLSRHRQDGFWTHADGDIDEINVTHWMPLPAPPTDAK